MSEITTLLDRAWNEALATTKPGTWYAAELAKGHDPLGHWKTFRSLLTQAKAVDALGTPTLTSSHTPPRVGDTLAVV